MPRQAQWPPPIHRTVRGAARVRIAGHDHYLGAYGSEEAAREFARLIKDGPPEPGEDWGKRKKPRPLTVAEAVERYDAFADVHYRHPDDGRSTSEIAYVRAAGKVLLAVCPAMKADDFRGKALKAARDAMVAKGWCRTNVNHHVNVVKRMWKWLASEELVSAEAYGSLRAVEALKAGRTTARESPRVRPAPPDHVEAALAYLTPHLQAAVRLQVYTACRPGEALAFDPAHVERREGGVWLWRPARHKTQHHGKERLILVGPRAQAVLLPLLATHVSGPLFSPRRSEALRRAAIRAGARTPRPTPLAGRYPQGDRFDGIAYARAVTRACARAEVPRWRPNQLRHAAATLLAAEFGPVVAQTILGHSHLRTTEVYAERDLAAALAAVGKAG